MHISFTKPIKYQDKELQEVDLNLDNLTGKDLIDVEDALKLKGINVAAWEFSRSFLIGIAAKALNIPQEALLGLNAGDFTKIVNEVLAFLAGTASSESTQKD